MVDVAKTIDMIRNRSAENQTSVRYDGRFLVPGDLVDQPNLDMSLLDAVLTRRTSRSYRAEPVPYGLFERLVTLASYAPSSCNEQKWKIIYIDDKAILEDLYWRGSAAFLKKVDQAFLVLYNNQTDNTKYWDHVQSAASWITTFSLLAHSVGVGTCWIGHLPRRREIQRVFGIDPRFDPIALVSFGFYRNRVKPRPRKREGADMISRNVFDFKNLSFQSDKNVVARTIVGRIYYLVPPVIRRHIRRWTLPYEKKFYDEVSD